MSTLVSNKDIRDTLQLMILARDPLLFPLIKYNFASSNLDIFYRPHIERVSGLSNSKNRKKWTWPNGEVHWEGHHKAKNATSLLLTHHYKDNLYFFGSKSFVDRKILLDYDDMTLWNKFIDKSKIHDRFHSSYELPLTQRFFEEKVLTHFLCHKLARLYFLDDKIPVVEQLNLDIVQTQYFNYQTRKLEQEQQYICRMKLFGKNDTINTSFIVPGLQANLSTHNLVDLLPYIKRMISQIHRNRFQLEQTIECYKKYLARPFRDIFDYPNKEDEPLISRKMYEPVKVY